MRLTKFFKGLATLTPIVGGFCVATSCNGDPTSYIQPEWEYDASQVSASCTGITLKNSFTITANAADSYKIKTLVVTINEGEVATTHPTATTWVVSGDDVTSDKIKITITCEFYENAETYIKNRTFGIASTVSGSWQCCGTGWIVCDATPDTYDDYSYYLATNWHVKYGVDEAYPGDHISYRCEEMSTNQYQNFTSCEWLDWKKFSYENDKMKSIDFYIAKVNFGTSSTINTNVKKRLDILNGLQEKQGYINKFAKTTDSSSYCGKTMYCGGYPAKQVNYSSAQKWKFETITANATEYFTKNYEFIEGYPGHSIDADDPEEATITDISPQYSYKNGFLCKYDSFFQEYMPINWSLTGGASGSMLISQIDGEWQIVGIYWGGFSSVGSSVYFYPTWSLFKTDYKNFVEDYE